MMTMCDSATLLRVTPADGGARLLLTLESEGGGKETLTLLTARLTALPRTGEISAETLDFYRQEAAVTEAVTVGMRLLAAGGSSAKALWQKLRQRGIPSDAADAAESHRARAEHGECVRRRQVLYVYEPARELLADQHGVAAHDLAPHVALRVARARADAR